MNNRNLFLLRGFPGAGKSTFIDKNKLKLCTVSLDEIRGLYSNPEFNRSGTPVFSQRDNAYIFKKILPSILNNRLEQGSNIIIDATFLGSGNSIHDQFKELLNKHDYKLYIIDFDVPVEVCMQRNLDREEYKVVNINAPLYQTKKEVLFSNEKYTVISPESFINDFVEKTYESMAIDLSGKSICHIGDIHSNAQTLRNAINNNSADVYIFSGDLFDRGSDPVGVINCINELKIKTRKEVYLIAGNHEKTFFK